MNILEQADKYAEGKANEAITKAIAEAYIAGYKTGYKDREEEIPFELRDNKTEYVDLGLPSRTLWSTDYEKLDGKRLYLPYDKAEYMKLPTKEQWEELFSNCKWEWEKQWNNANAPYARAICVGPNGQTLIFERTGKIKVSRKIIDDSTYFWIENNEDGTEKASVWLYMQHGFVTKNFSGYKLPVRTVR